jgi:hypothetical protein
LHQRKKLHAKMALSRFNEHVSQHYNGKSKSEDSNESTDLNKLIFHEGVIDFGNRRITNIAAPTTALCVVTVEYLEEKLKKTLRQVNSNKIATDAKGQRLRNVKDAEDLTDAITKRQLLESLDEIKKQIRPLNAQLDANNKAIINVGDGINMTDAISIKQLMEIITEFKYHVPFAEDSKDDFTFKKKRLMDVGDPIYAKDAVTKAYVDNLIKNEFIKLKAALKKPHV